MISKFRTNRKVFYLKNDPKFPFHWVFSVRPLNLGYSLKLVQIGGSLLEYIHD